MAAGTASPASVSERQALMAHSHAPLMQSAVACSSGVIAFGNDGTRLRIRALRPVKLPDCLIVLEATPGIEPG